MQVRGKLAIETGPPLLERESSLALLTEYAAQAASGEGRLVLLSGEAGVGKSALAERLRRDLPDARWSWSMCDGLFTPRPLGPLFDLADQFGRALQERCRAARLASHREAAAQYERALRSAGCADPVTLARLHEGLADEAALLDRWHDAETAGERALALWREAGDRLREGDALWRLSRIRWNLCRGRAAVDAAQAAMSALEPLCVPTRTAARRVALSA